jgi:hypothetical protein
MHGDRLQRLGSSPLWVHERLSVIQPQLVIHGVTEFLFATQTAFRRSYRNVPQKKLDLFQFTTCEVTQTCMWISARVTDPPDLRAMRIQNSGMLL